MIKEFFEKEELKNYVISQEKECEKFIAELNREANSSFKILKSLSRADIEEEKKEEISFELIYLFRDLKFFPSDDFKTKFPKIGLRSSLRWFISLKKIMDEIEKINKIDGVYIPPYVALFHIDWHLNIKITDEVLQNLNMSGKRKKGDTGAKPLNNYYLEFFKTQRSIYNYKKSGKAFKGTKEEFLKKDLIERSEKIGKKVFNKKSFFRETLTGQTERYILNSLFNNIIFSPITPIRPQTKSVIVYDLFRLIMQDQTLNTEYEFLHGYSENSSYGTNFKKYQHHTLKSLLGL